MRKEPDDLSPAELETEGHLLPDREVMSLIAPVEVPEFTIQPIEESNEASISRSRSNNSQVRKPGRTGSSESEATPRARYGG